jgi:Zn-dependent protease with chaperone function/RNA polymerase subunit RPABC4/transcription elongation factor Spt4
MPTFNDAKVFAADHVILQDISYKAFTYPGDEEALNALKAIPGAVPLLTYLQQNFDDQLSFLLNNQQKVRCTPENYPSLHRLVERCAEIMSCPMPEVYVYNSPNDDAYTTGVRRTCVVFSSGLLEQFTPDELAFIIGHELGHIKHGSGIYRMLGAYLIQYWDIVSGLVPLPGLSLLRLPLLFAYWEWFRRNEFTCDRAGLLCCQDPGSSLTALAKLAGRIEGYESEFNLDATIEQCKAREEVKNKLVLLTSILQSFGSTHPFIPERLKQVRDFAASVQYGEILGGQYERDVLGLHELGQRIKCPHCGTLVNAKLKFCHECGTDLSDAAGPQDTACVGCGEPLVAGAKFCPRCGTQQPDNPGGGGPAPLSAGAKLQNTISSFMKKG